MFLRELVDPLIPFNFYERFVASMRKFSFDSCNNLTLQNAGIQEYNDRLCEIKTLTQALPRENYVVLEYLMRHLTRVSALSDVNKMEPSNIAIVFGYWLLKAILRANLTSSVLHSFARTPSLETCRLRTREC